MFEVLVLLSSLLSIVFQDLVFIGNPLEEEATITGNYTQQVALLSSVKQVPMFSSIKQEPTFLSIKQVQMFQVSNRYQCVQVSNMYQCFEYQTGMIVFEYQRGIIVLKNLNHIWHWQSVHQVSKRLLLLKKLDGFPIIRLSLNQINWVQMNSSHVEKYRFNQKCVALYMVMGKKWAMGW